MAKKKPAQSLFEIMHPTGSETGKTDAENDRNPGKIIRLSQKRDERRIEAQPAGGPADGGGKSRGRTINVRIETAGVLMLGFVVLIVAAFFMGRLGAPVETAKVAEDGQTPLKPVVRAEPLAMAPSRPTTVLPKKYSIKLVEYGLGKKAVAEEWLGHLRSKGFHDAFLKRSGNVLVLYVGHFTAKNSPAAIETLKKIRNLKIKKQKYFTKAQIKALP